jgi:hypothetical protein
LLVEAVVPEEATESLSFPVFAFVLSAHEYNKNDEKRIAENDFSCRIFLFLKNDFFEVEIILRGIFFSNWHQLKMEYQICRPLPQ